jgi:hypothetical protein
LLNRVQAGTVKKPCDNEALADPLRPEKSRFSSQTVGCGAAAPSL